jgi:hypothetical protein
MLNQTNPALARQSASVPAIFYLTETYIYLFLFVKLGRPVMWLFGEPCILNVVCTALGIRMDKCPTGEPPLTKTNF